MFWRKIESAPRDGRNILGLTCYGVEAVRYTRHNGEFWPNSGWIGIEQDSDCHPGNFNKGPECQPTHWKPYPKIPLTQRIKLFLSSFNS